MVYSSIEDLRTGYLFDLSSLTVLLSGDRDMSILANHGICIIMHDHVTHFVGFCFAFARQYCMTVLLFTTS